MAHLGWICENNHLCIHLRLTNIRDGPVCGIHYPAKRGIERSRRVTLQRFCELFVATQTDSLTGMSGQQKENGEATDFSPLALARCKLLTQR